MLPGFVIFANDDLVDQIKNVLRSQLFLDEIISGDEFDGYVSADPDYVNNLKAQKRRVLVVRSFNNLQNKQLADVVIFIKAGLASIQKNNFGPPGQTYPAANLTIVKLLGSSSIKEIAI